ncbi:alkyl sulfatase C-terminal domain-containing protein [Streptomyces sp. NPDC001478]
MSADAPAPLVARRRPAVKVVAAVAAPAVLAVGLTAYGARAYAHVAGVPVPQAQWAWAPLAVILAVQTFERLGHGAECGTWRNNYLMGAQELREGVTTTPISSGSMAGALSVGQVFDSLAIRVNGPKAWDESFTSLWHFTDLGRTYRLSLNNGVLTHAVVPDRQRGKANADLRLTLTKDRLADLLGGTTTEPIEHEGDLMVLHRLLDALDRTDPAFAIVTP